MCVRKVTEFYGSDEFCSVGSEVTDRSIINPGKGNN